MAVELPAWAHTVRPAQQAAVDQIVARFQGGASVVILDAPTGSGKTLVGELVRRALQVRGLYLCVDRGLQDQILRDFTYAAVIKGRRNYPTLNRPHLFPDLTADDCTGTSQRRCDWCDERSKCPYIVAKIQALGAELACGNTSYFMAEANGPGGFSEAGRAPEHRRLVIVDEADRLESVLLGAIAVIVSHQRLLEYGVAPLALDSTPDQMAKWLDAHVLPALERELSRGEPDPQRVSAMRRYRATQRLATRLEAVLEELPGGNWVLGHERKRDGINVLFKPVRVDEVARTILWPHATRWLLMSATILNPAGLARDLGLLGYADWAVVRMPSTFPPERRPVYALGTAPVTAKTEDSAVPKLVTALRQIMAQHPDERILVHTVSNRLMQKLQNYLRDNPRTMWYIGADSRTDLLAQYLSKPGAVLFAPALERGLDLPDDACRVVVVVKVPYPDLGDKQVAARLAGRNGQDWYRDQTLRSLVQMTGRGMRHKDDHCTSYILDTQFQTVLARHQGHLPSWWLEAVQ